MDIKEDKQDDINQEYSICCSKSSVGFIKFSSQFIISLTVLFFSMVMIIKSPDKDNSIFFSLISGILSLFLPPPSITHK